VSKLSYVVLPKKIHAKHVSMLSINSELVGEGLLLHIEN